MTTCGKASDDACTIESSVAFCAARCSDESPARNGLMTCVNEISSTRRGGSACDAHRVNQCAPRALGGARLGMCATRVRAICLTHASQQRGLDVGDLVTSSSRVSMYVRRSASDHAPDGTSSATEPLFLRFGLALIESVNARATFLPAGCGWGRGRGVTPL